MEGSAQRLPPVRRGPRDARASRSSSRSSSRCFGPPDASDAAPRTNVALRDAGIVAGGVQAALIAFAVAAFFHPVAYQFYFFCIAGLALAVQKRVPTPRSRRLTWRIGPCDEHRRTPIEPIRVLKIVPTLLCGGTENQFMTLSRSLNRRRFQVELACLRRMGPFVAEAAQRGMPLREYPIGPFRSARTLALQVRLARDIVRRRIEIVHAYNFYGNVFAIPPARLAAAPVVIASIRDRGPYLTPMQLRVQRLRLPRWPRASW